ncbi:type I restriction enzyme HsdR N-terminal domain-containing protein [Salinigranum sp. GCM10025319]|uniref:type I restriction enzyme HsdR N-terminal domain-containing protein n=1 Tax=Salinigranum sp. GCM10025319 TaxID=3252687 RepID=UPI00362053B4
MNTDAVREYVKQSRSLLEASPQMDEENTKVRLVQPFIDLLGWNLYSTEVEHEHGVQVGGGTVRVDYALMIGDTPVVLIEAKPARSDLTKKDLTQLRSYMRQVLQVDWGILTNGKEFEVLSKSGLDENGEEISLATFGLDELETQPELLEILSKDVIQSGRADEVASQIAQANRGIRYLDENDEQFANQVRELVESELGDVPIDTEEQSLQFVQDLRDALRERRQFIGESTAESRGVEVDSSIDADPLAEEDDTLEVNHLEGTIQRSEITGDDDAVVGVFPTQESGLEFLKENEAWGFVRIGRELDYAAMYVTGDVREVRYVAEVRDVVAPDDAELIRPAESYLDRDEIGSGKKVVRFKPGTLRKLEDPIPFETKYPQSRQYTTLGKLRQAETTDDLFN